MLKAGSTTPPPFPSSSRSESPSASNGSAAPPSSKRSRMDLDGGGDEGGDVKAMTSKQYMDRLVVPTMLRALSAVNKEVRGGMTGEMGGGTNDLSVSSPRSVRVTPSSS